AVTRRWWATEATGLSRRGLAEARGWSRLCEATTRIGLARSRRRLLTEPTRLPRRRTTEPARVPGRWLSAEARWRSLLCEPTTRSGLARSRRRLLTEPTRLPRRRTLRWLAEATLRVHRSRIVRRTRWWCVRNRWRWLLVRRHHLGRFRPWLPAPRGGLLPRSRRWNHLGRF